MATLELTDRTVLELAPRGAQQEFYDSAFSAGGSFGVRVGRGGRKAFFVIYRLRGKRRRLTLGNFPVVGVDSAKQRALEALELAASGRDPKFEFSRRTLAPRVSDFVPIFIEGCRQRGLSERTIEEYARMLRREVLPTFGEAMLQDVKEEELRKLVESVAAGRGSLIMANRLRSVLRSLFAAARRQGIVKENPAARIGAPAVEGGAQRYLELEQLRTLWNAAEKQLEPRRSALKLLLLTAQRPGDVLAMQWDDLDVDAWMLRRARKGQTRFFEVPLPQIALALLREAKARQRAGVGDRVYVFASAPGRRLTFIRRTAKKIARDVGFDWRPGDVRRSAARIMLLEGVEPMVVKFLIGNATPSGLAPSDAQELHLRARDALSLWARLLTRPGDEPRPEPGGSGKRAKVIPLFG